MPLAWGCQLGSSSWSLPRLQSSPYLLILLCTFWQKRSWGSRRAEPTFWDLLCPSPKLPVTRQQGHTCCPFSPPRLWSSLRPCKQGFCGCSKELATCRGKGKLLSRKGREASSHRGPRLPRPRAASGKEAALPWCPEDRQRGCLPQPAGGATSACERPAAEGSFLEPKRGLIVFGQDSSVWEGGAYPGSQRQALSPSGRVLVPRSPTEGCGLAHAHSGPLCGRALCLTCASPVGWLGTGDAVAFGFIISFSNKRTCPA